MKFRHWVALGLMVWAGAVARAAVELSAFMQLGEQPKFVLTDTDDRALSGWLGLGQSFHGYRLDGYDPDRGILSISKAEKRFELTLRGAHVMPVVVSLPPELVEHGITPGDLIVRESGPVRIALTVGATEKPVARRFIDVKFDNGTDRCAVEFGATGPQSISRSFVPEAVRLFVTDEDIAAINAHLAIVKAKWFGEGR